MSDERLYKSISEVADELKLPSHVIRFWETKFSIITPLKRAGGRRFYRSEDIFILKKVKDLLYSHSYSIKSVQKAIETGKFQEILEQELPKYSEDSVSNDNGIKSSVVAKAIDDLEEIKASLMDLL